MSDPGEHPALKRFSPTVKRITYALGKAAKWGIIGGVVAAVGYLALSPVLVPLLAVLGIGGGMAAGIAGLAGGFGMVGAGASAVIAGLGVLAAPVLAGAAAGALFGGVTGLANSGSAVEEAKEQLVADYERREVREERLKQLALQREQQKLAIMQQQQAMGVTPSMLPPMFKGPEGRDRA